MGGVDGAVNGRIGEGVRKSSWGRGEQAREGWSWGGGEGDELRRGDGRRGERGDRGVAGGDTGVMSVDRGFNKILFCGLLVIEREFGDVGVPGSSAEGLLLEKLFPSELGDDWISSISSFAWIGLSSIISVRRLLRLLLLMVEVEVEFVRRAILSSVISFGVEVSSRKSLSRKKFKTVCKWTCARATSANSINKGITFNDSGTIWMSIL